MKRTARLSVLSKRVGSSVLRTSAALVTCLAWALPGAQAATKPQPFPCKPGGPCYVWLHGTIHFTQDGDFTVYGVHHTIREDLSIVVGLTRREDGLPSAVYSDTFYGDEGGGPCKVISITKGSGGGKGHMQFGSGLQNHAWYWDKHYHFLFTGDAPFPAVDEAAGAGSKNICDLKPRSSHATPAPVDIEYLTPSLKTNAVTLQGMEITTGQVDDPNQLASLTPVGDTMGISCGLPAEGKGYNRCTAKWKLTAAFSSEAQPGP